MLFCLLIFEKVSFLKHTKSDTDTDILPHLHLLLSRSLEMLILDEADRLLSLGFEQQLTTCLGFCPKQRR